MIELLLIFFGHKAVGITSRRRVRPLGHAPCSVAAQISDLISGLRGGYKAGFSVFIGSSRNHVFDFCQLLLVFVGERAPFKLGYFFFGSADFSVKDFHIGIIVFAIDAKTPLPERHLRVFRLNAI